jgi:hypothetical protein
VELITASAAMQAPTEGKYITRIIPGSRKYIDKFVMAASNARADGASVVGYSASNIYRARKVLNIVIIIMMIIENKVVKYARYSCSASRSE